MYILQRGWCLYQDSMCLSCFRYDWRVLWCFVVISRQYLRITNFLFPGNAFSAKNDIDPLPLNNLLDTVFWRSVAHTYPHKTAVIGTTDSNCGVYKFPEAKPLRMDDSQR